jgi:hypothetical protein
MNNNKITKRDIIEGMGFILMVVSIIALMGALYQLKEIKEDIRDSLHSREYKIQRSK